MKKKIFIGFLLCISTSLVFSQNSEIKIDEKPNFYIGYDLGEMAFNKFQNFAGEFGVRFKNDHMFRLVYINIKLTEQHLSSDFVGAVDGDDVKGHWRGYEILYDLSLYRFKKWDSFIYAGLSAGYHDNFYEHTILDESFRHKTATVGFDVGYREQNVFKIKGLYYNFQIPVRYNFKTQEEMILGETIVSKSIVNQTISFYIGYEF